MNWKLFYYLFFTFGIEKSFQPSTCVPHGMIFKITYCLILELRNTQKAFWNIAYFLDATMKAVSSIGSTQIVQLGNYPLHGFQYLHLVHRLLLGLNISNTQWDRRLQKFPLTCAVIPAFNGWILLVVFGGKKLTTVWFNVGRVFSDPCAEKFSVIKRIFLDLMWPM